MSTIDRFQPKNPVTDATKSLVPRKVESTMADEVSIGAVGTLVVPPRPAEVNPTSEPKPGEATAAGHGQGHEPESGPPVTGPSNTAGLIRLIVIVAAIAAALLLLGAGGVLLFAVILIVIVMVHELGHFATAKWAGMKVTEYFVGFGPRLWSVRRGETDYGIKPILAGGYVKIIGMSNLEEVDPADEARTYRQQPFHKRIIVASAGSFMHFVMAFLLAYIAVVGFGVASNNIGVHSLTNFGSVQSPAKAAGLRSGDVIVSVNGKPLTNDNQFHDAVTNSVGKPVTVGVKRDGKTISVTMTPVDGRHIKVDGQTLAPASDKNPQGFVGITEQNEYSSEGPFRAVGTAAIIVGRTTALVIEGVGKLFSPHGLSSLFHQDTNSKVAEQAAKNPTTSVRPTSIVGIGRDFTEAQQGGVIDVIALLIALNIGLAILNMLPMLPLDGGYVAIAIYERFRTRRGQPYYQADAAKLMPVIYVFVTLILFVVISAMFLDIAHPSANPF